MRVLHVSAELYPLVKTGGLADVTAALPAALARHGQDVRLLLPGLPAFLSGVRDLKPVASLAGAPGGVPATLLLGWLPDSKVPAYVIEAPHLYDRPGNPYLGSDGQDWPDNHRRFALLGWAATQLATGAADAAWTPHIVHGHDWHAGLAPAYMRARGIAAGTVFTVHNIAYQGLFPSSVFGELGLPPAFNSIAGVEFHGHVSFMKAGLIYADRVTTVSPTYAREIGDAAHGHGLEGVINARDGAVSGILNGVDYRVWNPAADPALTAYYSADNLAGKAAQKAELQSAMGLDRRPDALLCGVVSRLTTQKGLDLVLAAIPELVRQGAQLALLGSGDAALERAFRAAAAAHHGAVAVHVGHDEAFSHVVVAGADVILVPSRFEPCGLTQLYGLHYGTLPVVRRTGGLADTVVDSETGFVFNDADVGGLLWAIGRALAAYSDLKAWQAMQRRAMAEDFSWDEAALKYVALYRGLRPEAVPLAKRTGAKRPR